jgi:hypothetical protein
VGDSGTLSSLGLEPLAADVGVVESGSQKLKVLPSP